MNPITIASAQLDRAINKIEQRIPKLIRDRLWLHGTYADGTRIYTYKAQRPNVYTLRTISQKMLTGAPTDRVTLKDSGNFYLSMKVVNHKFKANTSYVDENVDAQRALGITIEEQEEIEIQTQEAVERAVAKMDDVEFS